MTSRPKPDRRRRGYRDATGKIRMKPKTEFGRAAVVFLNKHGGWDYFGGKPMSRSTVAAVLRGARPYDKAFLEQLGSVLGLDCTEWVEYRLADARHQLDERPSGVGRQKAIERLQRIQGAEALYDALEGVDLDEVRQQVRAVAALQQELQAARTTNTQLQHAIDRLEADRRRGGGRLGGA